MNDGPEEDVEDAAEIRLALFRLRCAHRELDAAVDALQLHPRPDQLDLARLKKRKLAMLDQIARLEDRLTPNLIA